MLIRADARAIPLRDGCVDCVVTSPPYWRLRDYGNAAQIGLEATPDAYVRAIVDMCRDVWRVLKPAGTLWLNVGDCYAGSIQNGGKQGLNGISNGSKHAAQHTGISAGVPIGLKAKDLVGIPWRVAFALQADGWYLRSDIIWSKPNPMPESVTDRPTKAHEYVFLLAKSDRYYFDAAAIAETSAGRTDMGRMNFGARLNEGGDWKSPRPAEKEIRNRRSVWTVATQAYSGAHFATMPEALARLCILAGCPAGGLVLDPFVGSGTVIAVATQNGRRAVGVDLAYQGLAAARTAQRGLIFAEQLA